MTIKRSTDTGNNAGEANGFSKLTEAAVTDMRLHYWTCRALRTRPRVTIQALAEEQGVTYYCAYAAVHGITWAHLPDPVIPTRCQQTLDMFEAPLPRGSHAIKHRAEVVELARWLSGIDGMGDRTIGYLVNVPHTTVQSWREGRMRASAHAR